MRRRASSQGERLIEFLTGGIVVLRLNIFLLIAVIFFFPVVNAAIAGLKEEKPPSGEAPSARSRSEFGRLLEKSGQLGKHKPSQNKKPPHNAPKKPSSKFRVERIIWEAYNKTRWYHWAIFKSWQGLQVPNLKLQIPNKGSNPKLQNGGRR